MSPRHDAAAELTLLVFAVQDRTCALRRAAVRELLPLPRLWHAPTLPAPLLGFMNLAGEAVPVLALDRLLELGAADPPPGLYAHLVLLEPAGGAAPLALLVSRALEVVTLPAAALRPVDPAATLNGCVAAAFERDGRFVHLLDPGRLLLERERLALAGLREAAARRLEAWGGAAA